MLYHTRSVDDVEFTKALVKELGTLDASFVLEWVRENFVPEDVFSNDALEDWAYANLTPLRHIKPADE